MFRTLWCSLCALAGAAMGALLLGARLGGGPMGTVAGGAVGLALGWGFGRLVSPFDLLD